MYTHTDTHTHTIMALNVSTSSCLTNLFGPIIRPVVWLRFLTGVKEQRLPSLPIHHPSFSHHRCWLPVSPFVPLSPPFTARPISGRIKQTYLRNPGLQGPAFDLSFLTDGPFSFWAPCWGPPPEKYITRPQGEYTGPCTKMQVWTWQIVLPSVGNSQLLLRQRHGEARSRVFREQTEGSLCVDTLMFFSNKMETGKRSLTCYLLHR